VSAKWSASATKGDRMDGFIRMGIEQLSQQADVGVYSFGLSMTGLVRFENHRSS